MEQSTYTKLMTALDVTEAEQLVIKAEADLAIAKLNHERCIAAVDLNNGSKPVVEEKQPKKQTQAATKKAATEDLKKVKEAVAKKTAADLGAEVPLSDTYKEGKVNLLGFLAPLHLLSSDARKPYIVDVELNKTKHADALEYGVMHLDLVQEVLDGMGTPADKHDNPAVTHEGIRSKVGAGLVDHMTGRVDQETLKRDLTALFKAVK